MTIKKRSLISIWFTGFSAGIALAAAISGLHQDVLGLEGYITYVRGHWVDLHWAFFLTMLVLTVVVNTAWVTKVIWPLEKDFAFFQKTMQDAFDRVLGNDKKHPRR